MRFKDFFVLAGFSIFPFLSNGQIEIGVKSGVNIATIDGRYSDPKTRLGGYGGGILNAPFSKAFGLRAELLYSSKGTGTSLTYYGPDYVPPKTKMRINYINLPILIFYKITEKLSVEAGPELGYLTSIKEIFPDVALDRGKGQPDEFDLSIDIGGEYRFLKKVGFEIRYSYGLKTLHYVDINNKAYPDNKAGNRILQIGFNYYLL